MSMGWNVALSIMLSKAILLSAFQMHPSSRAHFLFSYRTQRTMVLNSMKVPVPDSAKQSEVVTEIVTPPMQVYIEDTDAYGVIYNANYLRSYDRALHMESLDKKMANVPSSTTGSSMGNVLQHEGWSIVSVDEMKFKSSPPLGASFVIQGIMRASDISGRSEIWDMQMMQPNTSTSSVGSTSIYNTVKGIRIARPPDDDVPNDEWLPPFELFPDFEQQALKTTDTYGTYRDEFDPHLKSHMPLRNILNLFERTRSNALGGPDQLQKLKNEDGIIYVVTGVRDLKLVNYAIDDNNSLLMKPGDALKVETSFAFKRRGMFVDCYHTVKVASSGKIYAQGIVSMMALSEKTRRPTSKLPAWLLELFGIVS